ncbi:lipid-A-disaccharide synthase [Legionella sainthelensi]|nr:lipid-A-disaccharide synthase [Legionella sainthelensi]
MQESKRIVIIAGEESGDVHASVLIRQLKDAYPNIKISGIGGQHMQEAGAELISDLARFGVTGLTAVIRHLKVIREAFVAVKKHLNRQKPDLLILVDYPGFNLRLAKYAKQKLGIKILYYISPQIWAWKAKRIHLIKQCIDQMAVILPFEKVIYEKSGGSSKFCWPSFSRKKYLSPPAILKYNVTHLSFLPTVELLRFFQEAVIMKLSIICQFYVIQHCFFKKRHPNLYFVIPIANTINPEKIKHYFSENPLTDKFYRGTSIKLYGRSRFCHCFLGDCFS